MDIQTSSLSTNRPNLTQFSSGAPVTMVEQEQNTSATSPQAYNRDVFEYSSQQIPSLDVITRRILAAMYEAIKKAEQKREEQKIEDEAQAEKKKFKQQLKTEQEKDKDKKRETAALQSQGETSNAQQDTVAPLNPSKTETQPPVLGAEGQNLENARQLAQQVSGSILSANPATLAQLYDFTSGATHPPTEAEIIAAANATGAPVADTTSATSATGANPSAAAVA